MLLGLAAAGTWGAADFAGGLAARRGSPGLVVLLAQGTSLPLLGLASLTSPVHMSPRAILTGLFAGIAGSAALMVFYRALSRGAMGLSAALAGLLTAVLPVVLAIAHEGLPAPLQLGGFGLAGAAIVLIAYRPQAHDAALVPALGTLVMAMLAGAGFGLQLVGLHSSAAAAAPFLPSGASGASGASLAPVLRALLLSRVGGVGTALAVVLRTRLWTRRSLGNRPANTGDRSAFGALLALAVLAGLLDTAGNTFYMLSSLRGRLDVAAVLSSLYPGATMVLAALLLRERATRSQVVGMALALLAVAFVAG